MGNPYLVHNERLTSKNRKEKNFALKNRSNSYFQETPAFQSPILLQQYFFLGTPLRDLKRLFIQVYGFRKDDGMHRLRNIHSFIHLVNFNQFNPILGRLSAPLSMYFECFFVCFLFFFCFLNFFLSSKDFMEPLNITPK